MRTCRVVPWRSWAEPKEHRATHEPARRTGRTALIARRGHSERVPCCGRWLPGPPPVPVMLARQRLSGVQGRGGGGDPPKGGPDVIQDVIRRHRRIALDHLVREGDRVLGER